MNHRFAYTLILLLLWIPFGASISHAEPFVELTVERGDCLSKISEKWLQFPKEWPHLAELNNLKNPDLIYPGDRLIVPVDMLKGVPLDGVVTFVQGEALVWYADEQKTVPVRLNDMIHEGSRIITGNNGSVRVTFQGGYTLLIRSNTNLRIIQANEKRHSRLFFQIWMGLGRVLSRIKKATGADARFEVETPSAVAAVRGTEFRASVDADEDTRCEVLEGRLSLKAGDTEIQVKKGEGSVVRKGEAPSPPSELLAPPTVTVPSPEINRLPLELEFERIERAFRYRIMLATDPDFYAIVREILVVPDDRFRLDQIPDGTYFLRARSVDRAGIEGIDSEPLQFTVRVHPSPPVLSSPSGGPVFKSGIIRFSWGDVPGVERYRIRVQKDGMLHVLDEVVDKRTEQAFEFHPTAPSAYEVQVRSIAEDEYQGLWSEVSRLWVVPPPPTPVVDTPDKSKDRLTITSHPVEGPFSHVFQISRDPQFREIVFEKTTEEPEITLRKPEDPGTYYVRTSLRSPGFESDFSPSSTFEVKEDSPLLSAVLFVAFVLALILPASFLCLMLI